MKSDRNLPGTVDIQTITEEEAIALMEQMDVEVRQTTRRSTPIGPLVDPIDELVGHVDHIFSPLAFTNEAMDKAVERIREHYMEVPTGGITLTNTGTSTVSWAGFDVNQASDEELLAKIKAAVAAKPKLKRADYRRREKDRRRHAQLMETDKQREQKEDQRKQQ